MTFIVDPEGMKISLTHFASKAFTKITLVCFITVLLSGIRGYAQDIIPYLQTPSDTSIYISWKTDFGTETRVDYGTDPALLDQSVFGQTQKLDDPDYTGDYYYHSVQLTDLEASTQYYYKARAASHESEVYSFKTQPIAGSMDGHYRFLIFGDHQNPTHDGYQRLMQAAQEHVLQKYGGPVEEHINLIINDGDQVDQGNLWQYENIHFGKSAPLSPLLPIMTAVGNHETYGSLGLAAYYPHFFYDDISYKGITSPGGENYYSFQVGRAVFIMTSSEHPDQAQVDWVQQIVDSVEIDSQVDWLFSVGHRPIQAEQYVGDISAFIRDQLIPVLVQTEKSVLFIGGHHHLYARGQLRDSPMYHIISGAASWDQLWGQSTEIDFDDVQKTIDYWAYQIVDIDLVSQRMDVECYAIGSPTLGFTLDNVLIDSFHREFGKPVPLKPQITTSISDTIELPFTIASSEFQTGSDEELNSTQFQFSSNVEFTDLEVDLIRDFENLYGSTGSPDYLPIDIYEGLDILEFPINAFGLPNGKYFVRVRHRDQNTLWSEWSDSKSFVVKGSTDGVPEIWTDKSSFSPGETIKVSFKNGPDNPLDWIGIYRKGHTPGVENSTDWDYVGGSSGSVSLQVDDPGEYFIALFADDGYSEVCDRISIFIISIPVVETSKASYRTSEQIVVNYSNAPSFLNDWIGIYKEGDVPGTIGSTAWDYVSGESGTVSLSSLPEGYYFVNYFLLNAYEEPGERQYFTVSNNPASSGGSLEDQDFSLYPSPTDGLLHIDLQDSEEYILEIRATSLSGKQICLLKFEEHQQKKTASINLSGNAGGIYVVSIITPKATLNRKVILN